MATIVAACALALMPGALSGVTIPARGKSNIRLRLTMADLE